MRYKESLQNFIDDRIDTIDRSESDYIPYTTTDDIDVLKEAIDKANRYDELGTPKEVKIIDEPALYYIYYCPTCRETLMVDKNKHPKHLCNYCGSCGQALKWSNVND